MGAFTTLIGATTLELPLWAIVPLVLLVGAASGWGVERAAFRPFRKFTDEASLKSRAVREATLLSSFALGLVVREVLDQIYHGEWLAIPQEFLLSTPVTIGGIHLSVGEVAIAAVSLVMLARCNSCCTAPAPASPSAPCRRT